MCMKPAHLYSSCHPSLHAAQHGIGFATTTIYIQMECLMVAGVKPLTVYTVTTANASIYTPTLMIDENA